MSIYGFASSTELVGNIPTVVPPLFLAPFAAASITPPRPPHTNIAPAFAISDPNNSAFSRTSLEISFELPTTHICIFRFKETITSLSDTPIKFFLN
jgi:hypothetical protein